MGVDHFCPVFPNASKKNNLTKTPDFNLSHVLKPDQGVQLLKAQYSNSHQERVLL